MGLVGMEGPTRNAIWPVLLLLFSKLVIVQCLVGVEEVDKTCQSHETCMPNCAIFKEKLNEKNELPLGSAERDDLTNEIKSQVCNKKKRAFCCPCENNPCVSSKDCPQVLELSATRKRIKSSDPAAAAKILSRLKANICNKEERKICCPLKGSSEDLEKPDVETADTGLPGPLFPSVTNCGDRKDNGAQIVGGKEAEEGEFPWAALLGQTRKKRKRLNGKWIGYNETRWSCGGILITPKVVLTAAHCQGKTAGTKIQRVRLGEWKVAGQAQGIELQDAGEKLPPEQDFEIGPDDVIIHEDYGTVRQDNGKNIVNDIAIIFLPKSAVLNPGVQLVCLPHNDEEYRRELRVSNLVEDIVGKGPQWWVGDTPPDSTHMTSHFKATSKTMASPRKACRSLIFRFLIQRSAQKSLQASSLLKPKSVQVENLARTRVKEILEEAFIFRGSSTSLGISSEL